MIAENRILISHSTQPIAELRREMGTRTTTKITAIIGTADCEALLFHALGRTQSDLASIRKLLRLSIGEHLPAYEALRADAERLYLRGVDLADREQVSRAFLTLFSDVFMNNCTQRYCQQMVAAGADVYLYNMTYFNRESFGLFGFRMPFLGSAYRGGGGAKRMVRT